MRKVELRMNEQRKYEEIKNLVDHGGNKKRVALKLGISVRQVNRLIIIYKEKGKPGFVHGNRGKCPTKTLDKSFSENIILLYNTKYQDFNFRHFKEYLEEEEKIKVSYDFIYKTLTKAGILSPKARKKTKREFKKKQLLEEKKINLAMSEETIENIVNHEMALEDSHPRGEKPKFFGEVIEQDGSIHLWFGG
ncbi:MAG TPA: transposase, partial [Candidatus Faecimonas gallistercoris]|nr:transposase [Candidatus Faecimonas gallistercoris]